MAVYAIAALYGMKVELKVTFMNPFFMNKKRFLVLIGVFSISVFSLCVHIYIEHRRVKSERIRQLIVEAEESLYNIVKDN